MNKYPFSLNMEECKSNSNKHVFSILISYFNEVRGESVVEYDESTECKFINAENVFVEICKLFNKDEISCDNLVSDLSDICNKNFVKKYLIYPTLMMSYFIIFTTLLKTFCASLINF